MLPARFDFSSIFYVYDFNWGSFLFIDELEEDLEKASKPIYHVKTWILTIEMHVNHYFSI